MKKLMAMLLAAMLAMTMMSVSFAEEAPQPVFNPYEETVQVTIMGCDEKNSATQYDSSKHDRASANENVWIDAYKDYLNIEVTRIIPEDATARAAMINTMLASGDLPDIMIVPKDLFYTLCENGVLKDLKGAFDAYDGEYWMEIRNTCSDSHWASGMYEGEMLGLPYCDNFYNSTGILWVRQDWLDKVGMSVPTTLDELEEVAQAFVDNKLGGENTIGIGISPIGTWYTDISSIIAAYGVQLQTWVERDGQYVYSDTLPEVKDGLLKLQEFYKKGLLRSDFAVTETLEEDIANGVCGMFYGASWQGVTSVKASHLNDETSDWVPTLIPTVDGQCVAQRTNADIGNYIVVNKDYEHEDVIFRMKELESYVRLYSTPDSDMYKTMMFADDNTYAIWNLMVFRGLNRVDLDMYLGKLISEGLQKNTPLEEMSVLAQSQYQVCLDGLAGNRSTLGFALAYPMYPVVIDNLQQPGLLVSGYNGPQTENMNLYQSTINANLASAMVKVIMGDDVSVFDEAVKSWYANGGQAITDDVNAYYAQM